MSSTRARVARDETGTGWGASRPALTSAWSHAWTPSPELTQVVNHEGMPNSWITPFGVPVVGVAWSSVPAPDEVMVRWSDWQAEPSESTVMTPGTVGVPTVTCDPPLTASDVQPVGSSSQSAGVSCGPDGHGRAVADRIPARFPTERMPPKSDLSWDAIVTRMR